MLVGRAADPTEGSSTERGLTGGCLTAKDVARELRLPRRGACVHAARHSRRERQYPRHFHVTSSPSFGGVSGSRRQPVHCRTGSRGYFGNRGSSADSSHNQNVDPRADVIRRAFAQTPQSPTSLTGPEDTGVHPRTGADYPPLTSGYVVRVDLFIRIPASSSATRRSRCSCNSFI